MIALDDKRPLFRLTDPQVDYIATGVGASAKLSGFAKRHETHGWRYSMVSRTL